MAIRQGYEFGAILKSGQITPGISTDLDDYAFDEFDPGAFYISNFPGYGNGKLFRFFIAKSNATIKSGYRQNNWSDDFYDRIYIEPTLIDLGTIVSPQTRQVTLWNAWRQVSANLVGIVINGTPLEVTGNLPPYTFKPLQYGVYDITVNSTGAPDVNTQILFDFSNVPDPEIVLVIGTRAVRFGIVPEVPVRETWQWLTDMMVAVDSTEQRIAVRGEVPRVGMELQAVFTTRAEIDSFYAQLISSAGRLWVPEYQYATTATALALAGAVTVFLDTNATDIRAGEYALFDTKTNAFLANVLAVGSGFLTLESPLDFPVPKGSLIVPGAPCLLDEGTGVSRYAVDDAAETSLNARLQRYRTSLMRPGVAEVAATYLGTKVLERRPLAPELVDDNFVTGQEDQDNDTGVFDMLTHWNYTRVGGARQYKINRVKEPSEMDYWREILGYCRGKARMFWNPTYRKDLTFSTPPGSGGSVATIAGNDYALKVWPTPTHRHLEIKTAAGIHRMLVTNAVDASGNSGINFSPAWPAGAGWDQIERVSYLLPVRLDTDEVTWDHYGLESFLNLSIRSAEVQP